MGMCAHQSQPEGSNEQNTGEKSADPEGGNQEEKKGDKVEEKSVDIAGFYATGEHIWILGLSSSPYPCMLDVVEQTNDTFTFFTRFHQERQSFHRKDLLGKFTTKPTEGNTYNAMEVSPARENARRKYRRRRANLEYGA
ncbi:uncharacterized protein LOC125947146 [Dermacentor silvarum]|uniref:uncharacterized protein LOC125947146 n=1 Tax=Dermacentor silvarum TaxID=543639 RepID=UPI00210093C1|nr:uncharacterized protein LOC125947146 [Dermacentor silvarum]